MKNLLKSVIVISILLITFFSIHITSERTTSKAINFSYKDGLFYQKNSSELFTGKIIDTADVVIEFEVVNGKKNGSFKTYYLNGQIEKLGYIINNRNEGEWKYYFPNGQIESFGSFRKDLPEGKWEFYYENGIKKCEGDYKQGKRKGEWIYYDEKGKIINRLLLNNGILIDRLEKLT